MQTLIVNPDRNDPMTYGANCDAKYRFTNEQTLGIRLMLESAYSSDRETVSGRSYLR